MSWFSKQIKKVVKHIKEKPWWLDPIGAFAQGSYELYKGVKKNWNDIRTPLLYAGAAVAAAYTGGAALGALGIGSAGLSGAAGAAAGASSATGAAIAGGVAGATAGMQKNEAEKAALAQEEIAKQEAAEQERLAKLQALRDAGKTPEEAGSLDFGGIAQRSSQLKRNMVSRNTGKRVGGSSSTLG